ncbi:MAG: hypothetical protein KC464_12955, partial [Myxococcales bacterium]|nr:hypothetical protein [Myxococcales bacterium]
MTKVSWFGCARSGCRGPLAMPRGAIADGTARCRACGAMFPVLAGVPILVPAPAHWMAAHRDAILATLVEHDAATPRAVAVVDA